MDIVECLKAENTNARVSVGARWLYWDEISYEWVVVERKYGARANTVIVRTTGEERAVKALMEDNYVN